MFLNSRHRLFSLDARTGKPVPSFGNGGAVSLTEGLPRISDILHATQSSPPVVYQDLVIVGSQVPDRVQLPDPVGLRAGVRRANGQARLDLLRDPAVAEGSRRRDVGERVVAPERSRQRLGADGARRGARSSLSADIDAEQRLLRRRATGRESLRRIARLSRRRHRQDQVALPDGSSRALGLRQPGAAESGDDHRQRPADRRGRASDQAGLHLRVRSRDRRAGLADRRAAGATRQRRARREAVSDAAVSFQAAARSSIRASRSTMRTI